ncbi:hypothetical protein [uncultured Hoeflea sp.]|uniref:hypothetical protein n=1 Tax=uncultured Hoeflea sp. TaxID=538666 RepID=UPI0026028315|nr:hypothetical protein [uncultured Hoeflea sp.]
MNENTEEFETYTIEVRYDRQTKLPVFQRARLGNMRQDLPDGTPSEIGYDELGRIKYMARRLADEPHCEDGPAIVHVDPETGVHVSELFFLQGNPYPAERGPKHITRHSQTGEIVDEFYGDPPPDSSSPLTGRSPKGGIEPKP